MPQLSSNIASDRALAFWGQKLKGHECDGKICKCIKKFTVLSYALHESSHFDALGKRRSKPTTAEVKRTRVCQTATLLDTGLSWIAEKSIREIKIQGEAFCT